MKNVFRVLFICLVFALISADECYSSHDYINVCDYGANGSDGLDDYYAIMSAIIAADANETVYLPAGTYHISDAILVNDIKLQGAGWKATTLHVTGATNGIDMGPYGVIHDLRITGTSSAIAAIDLTGSTIGQIKRVRINGFRSGIGIKVYAAYRQRIEHLYLMDCAIGMLIDDNTTLEVVKSNFSGCTDHAIATSGSDAEGGFTECYFESNTGNITCDLTGASNSTFSFYRCGFEDNGGSTVSPKAIYHDGPRVLMVSMCSFSPFSLSYSGTAADICMEGSQNILLGNTFIQNTAANRYFLYGKGTGIHITRIGNFYDSSNIPVATLRSDYISNNTTYIPYVTILADRWRGSGGGTLSAKFALGTNDPNHALDVDGTIQCEKIIHGAITLTDAGPTDDVDVDDCDIVYIDTSSNNVTIGGFTNGDAGQIVRVVIVNPKNYTTLEHAEGTGNQDIYLNTGADETLKASYGGWTLVCNGTHWYEVEN